MNRSIALTAAVFFSFIFSLSVAADRADELREEMWNSSDKDFKAVAVPEKWKNKSAVIIAQLHRFEYGKVVMASVLRVNQYSHYRIKLNDKNSITRYSELSYNTDQAGFKVYVGFKVIKPNGREVVVDLTNAVIMKRNGNDRYSYKKIAIPNLEEGDILDYYICEEELRTRDSQIEFFEPIIHNLPQEYPVIKQKLQFKVMRRCYINLRSLNGAPELKKVVDEEKDETYYSLEDGDREGIADVRWLYGNRELPTVKFRATYAVNDGIADAYNVLVGEPGEVKSKVADHELVSFTSKLFETHLPAPLFRDVKDNMKGMSDPHALATSTYYAFRAALLKDVEDETVQGFSWSRPSGFRWEDQFSDVLTEVKVPHEMVIAVRRNISGIDDVVIENELDFLIRVPKGDKYLYFMNPDMYSEPGVAPRLEGTEAFAIDMSLPAKRRIAKRITLPASTADQNVTETSLKINIDDLSVMKISSTNKLIGFNKYYQQVDLLDCYDVIPEDEVKLPGYKVLFKNEKMKKKDWAVKKDAYMKSRDKARLDYLKESISQDYDFKIGEVTNLKIEQTGRYEVKPELIYSFDFTTDELIKKTGPNYFIDVGRLIEQQVQVKEDELKRDHGIYFENPRQFKYKIEIAIPSGFDVQGLENLNTKVENGTGGFVSTAKFEGGKLLIETFKHYDKATLSKDHWPSVVAFLNAANTFYGQKVLLKKRS